MNHPKRGPCTLLKQILLLEIAVCPQPSGLRTLSPSRGFTDGISCLKLHTHTCTHLCGPPELVWPSAFYWQYWFWLYNTPVIPIIKTRKKAQLNDLSRLTEKWVSELRIESRSPEVSLLETFLLSSSFESLFSTGAGHLKSGQYSDRLAFPEGNKAFQAHFTKEASLLGLLRFCSSHRTLKNPAIRPVQPERFHRRWRCTETAHYLKTASHNMFLWTSETNLWKGPRWGPCWPELHSESVPIPPLYPVCVYGRKNKFSFRFCTCICTATFLGVTSWLYLKTGNKTQLTIKNC